MQVTTQLRLSIREAENLRAMYEKVSKAATTKYRNLVARAQQPEPPDDMEVRLEVARKQVNGLTQSAFYRYLLSVALESAEHLSPDELLSAMSRDTTLRPGRPEKDGVL